MKLKIFGGYAHAHKAAPFGYAEYTSPVVIVAHNLSEATGEALALARSLFPLNDGFTDHHAGVTEVPQEWYTSLVEGQEHGEETETATGGHGGV